MAGSGKTIVFDTFHLHGWTARDQAIKVLEEAAEAFSAVETYEGDCDKLHVMIECLDVMQAAANLIDVVAGDCDWNGIYQDFVAGKNKERGYYDD